MALRYCLEPGCCALVPKGRCEAHGGANNQKPYRWDTERRPDVVRLRGRANQERRRRLFAREPLCRECRKADRVTVATIRDHIIPLAEGGLETEANEQPLCQHCSDIKTQAEARRGQAARR